MDEDLRETIEAWKSVMKTALIKEGLMESDEEKAKDNPCIESTEKLSSTGFYIVRFYDVCDGWIDLTGSLPHEEAQKLWLEYTKNGTEHTCYDHMEYYRIFPDNTQMLQSAERRGR